MADEGFSISELLLPANQTASLRIVVFAISLALLGYVAMGFLWFSETVFTVGLDISVVYLLCGVAIIGAAINGYVNDDVLVSCFIAVGPLVGFALFPLTVEFLTDMDALSEIGTTPLVVGGITALVGSIIGLLGALAGRRYGGGRGSPSLE